MNQDVRKLDDNILIAILDKRVELEAENEAEIIDFIREVMRRRLFLQFGADSMYDFLTRARFHYAPAVAQRKLDAARLMEVFPEVKDYISTHEINLTQLGMLAAGLRQKSIPPKEQRKILEAMRGQTIKNTQIILNEALEIEPKLQQKIRVQADGSVRAELTFSKEQWEDINRAKEVVSHSVPSGDLAEVLTYCAKVTNQKKDPFTSKREVMPRQCRDVSRRDYRFVLRRDKSCRFRHADGSFCESKYQLQVDHIISRSEGGSNGVENLQAMCGVHNRYKYWKERDPAYS